MARLSFVKRHNQLAFLEKSDDNETFHQAVDFLNNSYVRFALLVNPTIFESQISQFWQTAKLNTLEDGIQELMAKVDGRTLTFTESSIRRHLRLDDSDGISQLPDTKIFENLTKMGYNVTSTKLTFLKKHFTPQWRFLIHTILHCLSQKKTSWEQFSGNMAAALICLATNKKFNFSKYIFEGLVKNVDSDTKFLMYPRFIQCLINKSKHLLLPPNKPFKTPKLTHKVFSNMKIGFQGEEVPLFEEMLPQHSEEPNHPSPHSPPVPSPTPPVPSVTPPSTVPLPSPQQTHTPSATSPSLSHHNSPPQSPPQQNVDAQTIRELKEQVQHLKTSLESQNKHFTEINTKLVKRVEKLELKVKLLKGKKSTQLFVSSSSSSDAEGLGLSSKKGRMGSSKDEEEIQFQFHEGTPVIDEEPATQEQEPVSLKDTAATDTAEAEQEPAGIQRLLDMNLKGSAQVSYKRKRGSQPQGRFSVSDEQSAAPSPVSSSKDKGKKIVVDDEPKPKKMKQQEQVQLAVDEELSKKLHEEEVLRAEEESRMLQEKFDAQLQYIISIDPIVRGEAYTLICDESLSSEEMTIKLNDFITKKYNQEALDDVYQQIQKNQKKGFKMPHSEADQKKFFKIYLKREVNMKDHQLKDKSFDELKLLYLEAYKRNKTSFLMDTQERPSKGREDDQKEQKEKAELPSVQSREMVVHVPQVVFAEPLHARHPVIDWEIFNDKFGKAWKITRVGNKVEIFKNFENLLRACSRMDLDELWVLVQEKLKTKYKPDAKEQELWVEFSRLYDPNPTDTHWKFPYYDLSVTWEYFSMSHVHHLSTQSGIELFMLGEKEYPLSYEVLSVLISNKLLCEEETDAVKRLKESILDQYESLRRSR